MTEEEKLELAQLQLGWDAKKLSKGKMLRYVSLSKKAEQDKFQQALRSKDEHP